MNTNELRCVLERALARPDSTLRFGGVYPADEVPTVAPSPSSSTDSCYCYVANTDPHDKPGEHWVAFVALPNKCYEYFDPYGQPLEAYPTLYARMSHAAQCREPVATYIQPPISTTCGHFCIYFLCHRSMPNASFNVIVKRLLSVPMHSRDKFVYRYLFALTRALNISRPCRDACKGSQCCRPPARLYRQ